MTDQLFDSGDVEPAGSGIPEVGPDAPLAARMRPASLDEVVGQDHILAPGTALRGAVEGEAELGQRELPSILA